MQKNQDSQHLVIHQDMVDRFLTDLVRAGVDVKGLVTHIKKYNPWLQPSVKQEVAVNFQNYKARLKEFRDFYNKHAGKRLYIRDNKGNYAFIKLIRVSKKDQKVDMVVKFPNLTMSLNILTTMVPELPPGFEYAGHGEYGEMIFKKVENEA